MGNNASFVGDRVAASSGTFWSTTGSTSVPFLVPYNAIRTGYVMYNGTDQNVFVGFCSGNLDTHSNYSYVLMSSDIYQGQEARPYWGPFSFVWASAPSTGSLVFTELT